MPLDLVQLYRETLAVLSGERLVARALAGGVPGRARLLALGKASAAMARGAAAALGREVPGVAVGPEPAERPEGVRWLTGAHPIPDARSEAGARALLDEATSMDSAETALVLLSGGGSALAALPAAGLTLADKTEATRALLHGGAPIEEVNAIRKHLSALKGGRLASACRASRVLALVLCDIPSGELEAVASGPASGDRWTYAECLAAVERRGIALPAPVRAHLQRGVDGRIPETPKPGDPRLARVELVGLATPADLARTAVELARRRGAACEPGGVFTGAVEDVAERMLRAAEQLPPSAVLACAGEPTVRVPPGAGRGGRMQHLALLLARGLAGRPFRALCAGSDGCDGESAHAGALIDGRTAARAAAAGVDLDGAVARFDSEAVCHALGLAIPAFASDTNLCDLVVIEKEG